MSDRRRQFFEKLAELMEEHGVTMEVREDCGGYGGCLADGIDFDFEWRYDDEGVTSAGETVVWTGRCFTPEIMRELIEKSD